MRSNEPLTAAMRNELAWRIGEACRKAADASAGDLIDRGLALLHALNENGFDVVQRTADVRESDEALLLREAADLLDAFPGTGDYHGMPKWVAQVNVMRKRLRDAAAGVNASFEALDAARWRALLNIARIRPIGSAGLTKPEPNGYAHIGLELWTTYSMNGIEHLKGDLIEQNKLGREWLTKFADIAREQQGNAGV